MNGREELDDDEVGESDQDEGETTEDEMDED